MTYISKTDFVLWHSCPKNAWLRIHKPDVYYATELTEFEQSVIDAGIEVELVARNLFPDGVLITGGSQEEARTNTSTALESGNRTLFQPFFEHEQLLAMLDVLQYDDHKPEYAIYEVKASTEIKDEYLYDLAFQTVLLRQLGMNAGRALLVHLNGGYVRKDAFDLARLFKIVDVTDTIERIAEIVAAEMREARTYLLSDTEPPGPCSCIYKGRSKHCSTFKYSNPNVPTYGVHDIARVGSSPKKLRELVDAGILSLENIPAEIKLTRTQCAQLQAYRTGESIIDKAAISRELDELAFPLHFIDYETFAPPLPLFNDYSPYDQIPLQYSVHVVGSRSEEPIHRDFLHVGTNDPSSSFLDLLQQHVGSFGTIVVWNKAFESHVNDGIARRLPPARDYLIDFNDRIYDLMDIFTKQYFVHKDLLGKVSIKKVSPVLTPDLSYSALEIHDGAAASLAWSKLLSAALGPEESKELYRQLREYCTLDSYGMYAIWRALIGLSEG
jgi:hypothetical protein